MNDKEHFKLLHSRLVRSIVLSGGILLVLAFVILRYDGFFACIRTVLNVIRPLIIGIVIAFALNTPFLFLEKQIGRLTARFTKDHKPMPRLSFGVGLLLTYVLAIATLTGIICIIIPQIVDSIHLFSANFDSYYDNLNSIAERYKDTEVMQWIQNYDIKAKVTELADYAPEMLAKTYDVTTSFLSGIIDLVIGIVFSIYILSDKRNLKHMAQVLSRMALKKRYERFSDGMQLAVETFTKFLNGQLMEAFFIGVFCFIGMRIFRFDYPVLISVLIGLTNMVPIVGPIIGTIPCALILLLVNPRQVVWFVIFVIVLQQLESNLLYPRVVGSSVGLPPIWVLAAVTIGGGLGGVLGMVLGVPLASILHAFLQRRIAREEAGEHPVPPAPVPAAPVPVEPPKQQPKPKPKRR